MYPFLCGVTVVGAECGLKELGKQQEANNSYFQAERLRGGMR